jgi:ADP-ribosylglycohydrolase
VKEISEPEWEEAYHKLWQFRDKGLRPDFPFDEPNGYDEIIKNAADLPELIRIDDERYAEKIRGAWHGRCAGVVLGKPLETDVSRQDIINYLQSVSAYPLVDWVPAYSEKLDIRTSCHNSTKGNISYVEDDDDTRYTILALNLVEKKGLNFTHRDVCQNILDNVPYSLLWSATKQAIFHYINMTDDRPYEEQIKEFATKTNPMREGINGTIRADFWGYIAPGDPRRAARIAHREASVNMVKNGLYGSMFTAACISAALTKNPSVDTILLGGLSVIPKKSRLANVVEEVRGWYGKDIDWTVTCDRIYEKYGHLPSAGGLNNLAICVLALLHGNLDYTKTITTAVMCGMDTDCNGGTTGSIVGAAIGFDRIDPKWVAPFHDSIRTTAACYTFGSISELVQRTVLAYQKTKGE